VGLARVRAASGHGRACLGTARYAHAARSGPAGSSRARCLSHFPHVYSCTAGVVSRGPLLERSSVDAGAALRRRARAHRRFRRPGGRLLGRGLAGVLCGPAGVRMSGAAGVGWRPAWRQRAPTPLVRRCAPMVGRVVLHWPGCVPRIGPPWKASHGRGGVGGGQAQGRSPGLHLAAAGFPAWRRRNVRSARSCVKARLPAPTAWSCCCAAALTPARSTWLRSVSRKTKNCSDQPLNGQASVAHVLAHPLCGGHGKPSHPCVSLQHTALRNMPRNRHAFFVFKPHTTGRLP
jgi:hypothetical protein